MAEVVLFDIAEGIITKLGSVVLQEIGLLWGVKDELEKLSRSVSTIQAVLLDAEEQSMVSNQVKIWLGILKEAIYDADDLLDEFSTQALQQQVMTGNKRMKEVRLFFSSSNQIAYRHKMAHKIKAIRDRLDEIAADRKFLLEEGSRETHSYIKGSKGQTHSSPPEVVVGREHDKEAILELLLSSNDEMAVSVIPIVGMGGLGKTTLAQLVYNDQKIKTNFDLNAWVCISDNFDVELTVRKIIESASREKPRNSEMDPLKNLLHDSINGKKFLIVLDDLWSDDSLKWFHFKDLLAGGARGSKIMITTRLRKVAEMTRPISVHELKGLSEIESWSLFKQIAFKRGQLPTSSHEAIGKEIVAKCSGVPLAIKTIGGLLYFKNTESEWLTFKNKELSKVDQSENDILPTLKLSYNHLPSHFKHCFAYCCLYPKDWKIHVQQLVQLWMAQGYVKSSDPDLCLEDIGAEYFMDLFRMSFFQEIEKDDYGNITTCKMHDLMHDLAMLVAGEDCVQSNSKMACVNDKTRHVSVEFDGNCNFHLSLLKANKLRTLSLRVSGEERPQIREEQLHAIFCSLRYLRVLDLSHLGIKTVPCSICKLKHLRYLNLSWNMDIKTLPDCISKLQNLQVLNLSYTGIKTLLESITKLQNLRVLNLEGCFELTQLPNDIRKLVNLSHLDNERCNELTHMPRGIGQLTCLQKLSKFVVAKDNSVSRHSAGLAELHSLNNLRGNLEIENQRYVKNAAYEFKEANLKEKQHLQELSLQWNGYKDDNDNCGANDIENDELALEALQPDQNLKGLKLMSYRGVKSASWLSSLANLVSISFDNCNNIQRLPQFDNLPFLKRLCIFELTNLEYIDTGVNFDDGVSVPFFPSLTFIGIHCCNNLKGFVRCKTDVGIPAAASSFPCFESLSVLVIKYCPKLTFMPHFPTVEELAFGDDSLESLKNILNVSTSVSQSTSSLPPSISLFSALSKLKKLHIWETDDLLPELLQNLTSLQYLDFFNCPRTKTLSPDEKDDSMQWQGLKSLHSLSFQNMPKLESLPKELQSITTLRSLVINGCPSLKSSPDWMINLTSLQCFSISKCPQLSERCKNNMAEDWPKIAHIPVISINSKTIQKNGCYRL